MYYSPFLDQYGNQTVNPDTVHGIDVATGCNVNGNHVNALGDTTDITTINRGNANANNTGRVWNRFTDATTTNRSFYALSEVLTVISDVPPILLTLQVNPFTGATTLIGDSNAPLSINYYEISSAGESLDAVNWSSLAAQDLPGFPSGDGTGNGWEEAGGVGTHALAEAYLQGSSEIGASEAVSLGMGYDPSVNAQDLVFKYKVQPGKAVEGEVLYDNFNPDIDDSGSVDGADLGLVLSSYDPLAEGDDGVAPYSPAELAILLNSYGWTATEAATSEVPEPTSMVMLLFGTLGLSCVRRRK